MLNVDVDAGDLKVRCRHSASANPCTVRSRFCLEFVVDSYRWPSYSPGIMAKTTLTKLFLGAFYALLSLFTLGSAYAGSPDYSKGKNMVEPAPVCDPRWYISIGGGIDFDYGATDFVNGFDGGLDNTGLAATIRERSYNDVYDNTLYRIQGEVGMFSI